MKKKVNTAALVSELQGSVFFPPQKSERVSEQGREPIGNTSPKQQNTSSIAHPERPLTPTGQDVKRSTPVDPNASTGQRSNGSRMIKRHSFEFYKDQVEALQRLALEDKMQGGKGNQSDMIRNALDEYLLKRKET